MKNEWVELFTAGKHTDGHGRTRNWTTKDIDTMVNTFSAEGDRVPHVIGHPATDGPAWGWLAEVKRAGNSLMGKSRDLQTTFVKMINNKQFPNRSIAVRGDGSLRHVGWLGAKAPAVKGLGSATFGEEGKEYSEFIFANDDYVFNDDNNGGSGMTDAEKTELETAKQEAAAAKKQAAEFEESAKTEKAKAGKAQAELDTKNAEFAETEKKARSDENKTWIEKMTKEAKLIPGMVKAGIQEFMDSLTKSDTEITFAEGTKKPGLATFKEIIEAGNTHSLFTEMTPKNDKPGEKSSEFTETEEAGARAILAAAGVKKEGK